LGITFFSYGSFGGIWELGFGKNFWGFRLRVMGNIFVGNDKWLWEKLWLWEAGWSDSCRDLT
jgi:hypothetical protein